MTATKQTKPRRRTRRPVEKGGGETYALFLTDLNKAQPGQTDFIELGSVEHAHMLGFEAEEGQDVDTLELAYEIGGVPDKTVTKMIESRKSLLKSAIKNRDKRVTVPPGTPPMWNPEGEPADRFVEGGEVKGATPSFNSY